MNFAALNIAYLMNESKKLKHPVEVQNYATMIQISTYQQTQTQKLKPI